MWGSLPQEVLRELGLVLSSHGRIKGNYKKVNGAGKGKSCWGEGGLLRLLIFAEKKSEGYSYQLGCARTGTTMEELDGGFILRGGNHIVR